MCLLKPSRSDQCVQAPGVVWVVAALLAALLASFQLLASAGGREAPMEHSTLYRTIQIDGLSIFYREAGPKDAPTLLLLHGFPSSSRMFEPLFARLSDRYHLIAPDYPGFGHSDWPDPKKFVYTFDHIAELMNHFTEALGLSRYTLYMQDYGGPVGFRMILAHPDRVAALIVQDAVAHNTGLAANWKTRRAFWADRAANESALRVNLLSLETTKARHAGNDPNQERHDPDLWTDEFYFLNQPGQVISRWTPLQMRSRPWCVRLWGCRSKRRPKAPFSTAILGGGRSEIGSTCRCLGDVMVNRRNFLAALGVGSGSLLSLPAIARSGGAHMANWQPDGLGYRARIGLLTPNDDAVPESELWTMAPQGVSVHVTRGLLVNTRTFADPPHPDDAIALLSALPMQAIVFAFTTTSYILGPDGEQALKARLEKRSNEIPVLLPGSAAVAAFRALGVRRIALIHPPWFADDENQLGIAYFRNQRFDVVYASQMNLRGLPIAKPTDPLRKFTELYPAELYAFARTQVPATAEAVFFGGNGFRAIGVIEALEEDLGIPVLSGNQVTFWHALRQAGVRVRVTGYGRVFRTLN